ncbi:uncharacterized protein TNCV_4318211 [Trichonephila clavipes]|nr:uncharacterized protein TNCV_4318211 [Trichonephila clavipes]
MAALVSEYTLEFFTLLNARGKKELIEWCMKEGLIASSYECPKCNEQMGLNERKSVVLDGFEWRCRKKIMISDGEPLSGLRRDVSSRSSLKPICLSNGNIQNGTVVRRPRHGQSQKLQHRRRIDS